MGSAGLLTLLWLVRLRGRVRNRSFLRRAALPPPAHSPWMYVFRSQDDGAFRATMSMDVRCFELLHAAVLVHLETRARNATLDSRGVLALTLHWLNSIMRQKSLCQVFGVTPAACSRYLTQGLGALEYAADTMQECRIRWPTRARMDENAEKIIARVPGLSGFKVFGFVDGLNLRIENSSIESEQNVYYNGWLCGVYCSQVLVFDPEGLIIWVEYNCPGSWHDITVARKLIDFMRDMEEPYCLLGDAGFICGSELDTKILVPLTKVSGAPRNLPRCPQLRRRVLALSASVVKGRQAAEWGMRALQGMFSRLKSTLTVDKDKRAQILKVSFAMYNFQTREGMVNQIRTTFAQDWAHWELGESDWRCHVAQWYNESH